MKFTDLNDAITSLPIGRSILIKSNGGREWFGRVIECPRIVNYWGGSFIGVNVATPFKTTPVKTVAVELIKGIDVANRKHDQRQEDESNYQAMIGRSLHR